MGETLCIEQQKWKTYMCLHCVGIAQENRGWKDFDAMSSIGRATSG